MKTSKMASTITWNTDRHLRATLEALEKAKVISEWYYVRHQPEDDEGGKKEHVHLLIVPAKLIQTDDITDRLKEFDPLHPDKPIKPSFWKNSSSWAEWFMYGRHDKVYLLRHNSEPKRFTYDLPDFQSWNEDAFMERVHEALAEQKDDVYRRMYDHIQTGLAFPEYAQLYAVPIALYGQYKRAWDDIASAIRAREEYDGYDGYPPSLPLYPATGDTEQERSDSERTQTVDIIVMTERTPIAIANREEGPRKRRRPPMAL